MFTKRVIFVWLQNKPLNKLCELAASFSDMQVKVLLPNICCFGCGWWIPCPSKGRICFANKHVCPNELNYPSAIWYSLCDWPSISLYQKALAVSSVSRFLQNTSNVLLPVSKWTFFSTIRWSKEKKSCVMDSFSAGRNQGNQTSNPVNKAPFPSHWLQLLFHLCWVWRMRLACVWERACVTQSEQTASEQV